MNINKIIKLSEKTAKSEEELKVLNEEVNDLLKCVNAGKKIFNRKKAKNVLDKKVF